MLPNLSVITSLTPPSPVIAISSGPPFLPILYLGIGVANTVAACNAPIPIMYGNNAAPKTGPNPIGGGANAAIDDIAV